MFSGRQAAEPESPHGITWHNPALLNTLYVCMFHAESVECMECSQCFLMTWRLFDFHRQSRSTSGDSVRMEVVSVLMICSCRVFLQRFFPSIDKQNAFELQEEMKSRHKNMKYMIWCISLFDLELVKFTIILDLLIVHTQKQVGSKNLLNHKPEIHCMEIYYDGLLMFWLMDRRSQVATNWGKFLLWNYKYIFRNIYWRPTKLEDR